MYRRPERSRLRRNKRGLELRIHNARVERHMSQYNAKARRGRLW